MCGPPNYMCLRLYISKVSTYLIIMLLMNIKEK